MKPNVLFAGLLCILLVGCGSNGLAAMKPEVDAEFINKSSRDLHNTKVYFGERICEWGNVGKTFTAIYLYYPHPITARAELHWDESEGHRVEKLDLSKIYPAGKSGRLTFTVYDDRVEVTFREKS
jgi:hypothetical protein